MSAPFIPWFHERFDYDRSFVKVIMWYLVGSMLCLPLLEENIVVNLKNTTGVAVFTMTGVLSLAFLFAFAWQKYGRHLMPVTPYSKPATTFYDFTPRYLLGKIAEMFFQNIVAVIVVTNLYTYSGESLVHTGLTLGGLFFIPHAFAIYFLGGEWFAFVCIATLAVMIVLPVLILLTPGGYVLLFSFHMLMYLLFLIVMRRARL